MNLKLIFTLFGVSTFIVALLSSFSHISANGCIRANPWVQTDTIQISSSHDTFDRLPNFNATIRNDDSADCGVSNFFLGVNAPMEWDQSIDPYSFDLKPGESKMVKLFLKPTEETKRGTYPILLIINNWTARFSMPRVQSAVQYFFVVTDDPKPGPTRTPVPLRQRNIKFVASPTATPTSQILPSPSLIPTITLPIRQNMMHPTPIETDQSGFRSWWDTFLQFLSKLIGK